MDFARQQLEKYGWKDGEGLGKSQNGISQALKPKLKFDNAGLGHNLADEIVNPWWQRVYDSAAENVKIKQDGGFVSIEAGSTEVTTKRKKPKKSVTKEKYNNFVMRAALTQEGERRFGSDEEEFDEEPVKKKKTSGICDLTDEELFKACGGRTAHKGARHGLSMSAKLERSQKLEEEALASLRRNDSTSNMRPPANLKEVEEHIQKIKKKKKSKEKGEEKLIALPEESFVINVDLHESKMERKKRRKQEKAMLKDTTSKEDTNCDVSGEGIHDSNSELKRKKIKKSCAEVEGAANGEDESLTQLVEVKKKKKKRKHTKADD